MRQYYIKGAVVIAVLIFVSVAGWIINNRVHVTEPLPGWHIIRPPHEVSAMVLHDNAVWVGGRDGVFLLDRENGALIRELICDIRFSYVKALLVDQHGILWIGHQRGLTRYYEGDFTHFSQADGLPSDWVTSLLQDQNGNIWAGTFTGAAYLDNGQWHAITSANGLMTDMVNVLFQDSHGGIWFGSYVAPRGGLSCLSGNNWQYFTVDNGLPHNNINAIVEDQAGNIWAATGFFNSGGAAMLTRTSDGNWLVSKALGTEKGMAGAKVRTVFQDRDGIMWFGYEYDGMSAYYSGRWQTFTIRNGLSDNEVKVFLQDQCGRLWLGTHNGVTRIDSIANALNIFEKLNL